MQLSKTFKGVCCILSSICIHIVSFLIIGYYTVWANINVYYVSYVRLYNQSFTLMDGFFMVPILMFVNHYVVMLGGYVEKYSGPRLFKFNILGILCVLACHVLLYFFTEYWVIMVSMGLFGCGFGIGHMPLLKTSWRYFPHRKGLISGVVLASVPFSTLIMTTIADAIINPEGKSPVDDYFEYDIAIKTKDYMLRMIFVIIFLGTISNCLVFPYIEEDESNQSKENSQLVVVKQKERVKEVLRTKQFYLLGSMMIGNSFVGFLITNTNRTFGSISKIDQALLQTLSKAYSIMNGLSRLMWGIIYDKVHFRILYFIIMTNFLICSFAYYFSGKNGIAFFIVNCLGSLSFSGNATIFNPVLIHYFGIKNSVILSGIYQFANGVVGLINPLLCKFVVKKAEDFFIIYMIGGCFSLFSFIAFCLMKSDAYVYTWKSQIEKEKEEISKKANETPESGALAINASTSLIDVNKG